MTTCGLGACWLQRPGVCARLSKLVLDHSEPLAVLFREEVVEQGRLTTAEEAGKHSHRDALVFDSCIRHEAGEERNEEQKCAHTTVQVVCSRCRVALAALRSVDEGPGGDV